MPGRGLEPLRISPPDPKSGASANFATLAITPQIADSRFQIEFQQAPFEVSCREQGRLGSSRRRGDDGRWRRRWWWLLFRRGLSEFRIDLCRLGRANAVIIGVRFGQFALAEE